MLIEFKVSNYRSIGEEQILSLIPDNTKGDSSDNIIIRGKHKALNAISIYGNNASGKSNLLLAMSLLDKLVHLSGGSLSTSKLPYDPFLLREEWDRKPTKFEITFIIDETKYRYGVEFFQDKIVTEWLYRKVTGREVYLFLREEDIIDVSSTFKVNKMIINTVIEATRSNALFLSMCDTFNIDEAKMILQWFKYFQMIDGLNTETIKTVSLWKDEDYRKQINSYMKRLNLGLVGVDITTKDFDLSDLPEDLDENTKKTLTEHLSGAKSYTVYSKRKLYSKQGVETGKELKWKLERESAGTIAAFQLSGPILWALTNGSVLIVDEIDAKLHPIMTIEMINLFLNKQTNPNNAQLIFATHDTALLSYLNLRRDQIYFSEKNHWESTEIYSLSDFVYLKQGDKSKLEKERANTDKEKRYIEGRYGAIPVLSELNLEIIKNSILR